MTATPPIVDRETWQKQIDTQRVREKGAHPRGDAIAEARWRLPMDGRGRPDVGGGRRRGPAHRHLPGADRSSLRWGPLGGPGFWDIGGERAAA
jgi:Bacterial protein of unknown function (DUF899)